MNSKRRLEIVLIFFCFSFIILLGRLFYWQILANERLAVLAQNQQRSTIEIPAKRGEIFTSDGSYLVANQPSYLAYLVRKNKDLDPDLPKKLAPILADELSFAATPSVQLEETEIILANRFSDKNLIWIPLARRLNLEKKLQLEALAIPELNFEFSQTRLYPEASMAAHLLGFVGLTESGKETGLYGLEGFYQTELAGRPGLIRQERDAFNQPILNGQWQKQDPKDGRQLKLYIDKSLQFIIEKKLAKAIEQFGAKSGSITVMNPYTGAILAMSSLPAYDPISYYRFKPERYLNPVISQPFEPGSIFKVIVMAAALDVKAVDINTRCEICNGPVKIDKYFIKTWNDKYFPNSSMEDILVHSDNVGMVFISQKLGLEKFLDYYKKFGFTEPTGIDLQDEIVAVPKPDKSWTYVDLATASFGQGFVATGMQLLRAVAAIANGGQLVTPKVVAEVIAGGKSIPVPTKITRQVISPETSKTVTQMMVAAAKDGEAKWANVKGYQIAGKTGTAQIAVGGKYATSKTNASFIGFAPADKPRFVMLVTLQEPSTSQWASETAAPLWFSVAQDILNHFNLVPYSTIN